MSSNSHLLKEGTLEGEPRWSVEAKSRGFQVGFPLQSHLLLHIFMLQDGVDRAPLFFRTCITSTGWLTCRCCICAVDWALLTFLRDVYDVDRVACKGWSMLLIVSRRDAQGRKVYLYAVWSQCSVGRFWLNVCCHKQSLRACGET